MVSCTAPNRLVVSHKAHWSNYITLHYKTIYSGQSKQETHHEMR